MQTDAQSKANVLHEVLRRFAGGRKIEPELWKQFVFAQNDGATSGPNVGERVPDFTLTSQDGKSLALSDLMGPSGLLLVFHRSADW